MIVQLHGIRRPNRGPGYNDVAINEILQQDIVKMITMSGRLIFPDGNVWMNVPERNGVVETVSSLLGGPSH